MAPRPKATAFVGCPGSASPPSIDDLHRNNTVPVDKKDQQQVDLGCPLLEHAKELKGLANFHQPYRSNKFRLKSKRNTMSRPTGKVEDGSVMTNGTFMVMTRPDGTRGCVKHPQLVLEGWTCPECEKEFNEGHNALQQRKANLDNRLQALGEQQQQQQQQQAPTPQPQQQGGPAQHSPMGPMSVQAQQGLYGVAGGGGPPPMALGPYGAPGLAAGPYGVMPNPMAALSSSLQGMSMNGPPGTSGPPSGGSSASLETLALQINRMQQMQDWMLLQKEREVQMLRQELAESNQKLHTNQLEHALLQEKMAQQKIQHEQELKYLQLSAAAAANNSFQVPTNSNEEIQEALKESMKATAAGSATNPTMTSTPANKGAASKNNTVATGTANSTHPAAVRKQAPVPAKPNNVTPNNSVPPPAKPVNNSNVKANGVANSTTTNPVSNSNSNKAPAPVKNSASAPKKTAPKKNPPTAEAPKKATPFMKNPPPSNQPNSSSNANNPTSSGPNSSNNVTNNNNTNTNNTSSKNAPPPISHIKAPPPALSMNNKSDPFGIPTDINVDDDAPPTVPLQEDITLGTLGKTQSWRTSVLERTTRNVSSDRFEPRYIGTPGQGKGNTNNAANSNNNNPTTPEGGGGGEVDAAFPTMLPNDQQSLTVASSTYGEDRQKVVNQSLLDPYGDKGIYTGLILKSTGMPHGSGRMIYEEDQRIYEGEWRHGRWHGFGRAKFANGDSYEGEYRFDQRHGHGKYSWADGRSYDGQFSEDRRHGKGLFVWPDGAIYEGQFANGQREGHGSYKFSDGGQYTGDWKDGRYNGFGTCSWEDGRCYRGEWRNGMAHGKGIETYADGTVRHDGQWVDDEPVR